MSKFHTATALLLIASLFSIFPITVIVFFVGDYAFAQTVPEKPTPDHLAECGQLGIGPEKCSEQAILTKRGWEEFFRREAIRDAEGVKIDSNLIPIYIEVAAAFVAGIVYVKRTGRGKADN